MDTGLRCEIGTLLLLAAARDSYVTYLRNTFTGYISILPTPYSYQDVSTLLTPEAIIDGGSDSIQS